MTASDQPMSPEAIAEQLADGLALALEEAGFDVGREFPELAGMLDRRASPIVTVGDITVTTAHRLSVVLSRAATLGATAADL